MSSVTPTDPRDHGDEVLNRVARGEVLAVTRGGVEVAELRPWSRPGPSAAELVARRHNLPVIDPNLLRLDLDEVLAARW